MAEEMKGHPGYQGDHTDYCIDIIKQVGSPRLKLLFDIYHVQIMDGDIIRRIDQNAEYIGHVHTAGNPGRGELDDKQEINYPPIELFWRGVYPPGGQAAFHGTCGTEKATSGTKHEHMMEHRASTMHIPSSMQLFRQD